MMQQPIQLLFEAMYHGKYEVDDFLYGDVASHYDEAMVKGRQVYRPNKKLKVYHNFLTTFVFDYLAINERVVFAYRKGANLRSAVLAHAHSRSFLQSDLSSFFSSIDRALVKATLLAARETTPISDLEQHIERILDLTTVKGILPVGFSTSPIISNTCLTGFDNDLENICVDRGLIYTRYADDIIISGQERDAVSQMQHSLQELLTTHFAGKLQLNLTKSKLTHTGRKIKILGMVILPSGDVTIDMEWKQRFEVLLHYYITDSDRFLTLVDHDMKSGLEKLTGSVNYVNAVDPSYLDKLRRKFGTTVIDSLIHKSAS